MSPPTRRSVRRCGIAPAPDTTFPQIFIGRIHIGGCEELYALDREGKLDSLLAGEKANS